MRLPLRLLAGVKPERFLEAGNPTGLTGLFTHPKPRRALIYFYEQTLEKLKTLPENSVYRQSAEAITRRRLKIVESEKPDGFDDWFRRTKEKIENHASKRAKEREQKQEEMQDDPFEIGVNREFKASSAVIKSYMRIDLNSRNPTVYIREPKQEDDENEKEWNGLPIADDPLGEPYTTDEQLRNIKSPIGRNPQDIIDIEAEPPLEASQYVTSDDILNTYKLESY